MTTLKNSILALVLLVTATVFAQTPEIEFDTYSESKQNASKYLLANNVSLRDCPSSFCEKLTTIRIGTHVRLLEKAEKSQEINGITSRWYKVKLGPETGWIWGGLIAQKTLVSQANAEVKFVFGEAGFNGNDEKQFQLRAVKNGIELDKLIITSERLHYTNVQNIGNEGLKHVDDIIVFNYTAEDSCDVENKSLYIVWKNNKLQRTNNLIASAETLSSDACCYLYYSEIKE